MQSQEGNVDATSEDCSSSTIVKCDITLNYD